MGSVTLWLGRMKAGDRNEAVNRLWTTYFRRLIGLAQRHLGSRHRAVADEEDIALSAFDSFIVAAQNGRFPKLDDREDLWHVLFVITARKAADLIESEGRQKRGGGRVQVPLGGDSDEQPLPSDEPGPAEAAIMAEEFQRLLHTLPDPLLRQIAVWKLEGFSNSEISEKIGRSVPAVERKLRRIRETWQDLGPS
jgi:DNA-directed RNA polymerase specialized sigma24 family protein